MLAKKTHTTLGTPATAMIPETAVPTATSGMPAAAEMTATSGTPAAVESRIAKTYSAYSPYKLNMLLLILSII